MVRSKPLTPVDVFEFAGPRDLLACLDDMTSRYSKEVDSKTLAALTAVLAWSLVDWVYKAHGSRLGFKNANALGEEVRKREPIFGLLQGLANAFKHGGAVDHPTRIVSAEVERYFEAGYVEEGYVRDQLSIVDDAGVRTDCGVAFDRALAFWRDFFRDYQI